MKVLAPSTFFLFLFSCVQTGSDGNQNASESVPVDNSKIPVIFDTDANNELDDQHAMAYLFFNNDIFDVVGVTVNATFNGGDIDGHYSEAERIMRLCDVYQKIPLIAGANGDFTEIQSTIDNQDYDGKKAVDFIVKEARKDRNEKLILLPVGKLTNIALALKVAPDIRDRVRIVWLGSNYPEKGEYNQVNDIPSLNYILEQEVPFEMVMVRYGDPSGSDAVRATPEDIFSKMPGQGPTIQESIIGRHGGSFNTFGDYSVGLFKNAEMHGDPPSRALFDMVAVAILKNIKWGEFNKIPAPKLVNETWVERPENPRVIGIWENFDSNSILEDFYSVMQQAK